MIKKSDLALTPGMRLTLLLCIFIVCYIISVLCVQLTMHLCGTLVTHSQTSSRYLSIFSIAPPYYLVNIYLVLYLYGATTKNIILFYKPSVIFYPHYNIKMCFAFIGNTSKQFDVFMIHAIYHIYLFLSTKIS